LGIGVELGLVGFSEKCWLRDVAAFDRNPFSSFKHQAAVLCHESKSPSGSLEMAIATGLGSINSEYDRIKGRISYHTTARSANSAGKIF
jgi:hypothetical protein